MQISRIRLSEKVHALAHGRLSIWPEACACGFAVRPL